jgi:hypothetical protein
MFVFHTVTEIERACMQSCASQHAERRRPAAGLVQKMWSRGEKAQVAFGRGNKFLQGGMGLWRDQITDGRKQTQSYVIR